MSESAILDYLKSYRMEHPSLEEAVRKEPEKTMEKLRSAAYNKPELFTGEVRAFVLGRFEVDAYTVFSILHTLSSKREDLARELMDIYLKNFDKHPKDAVSEFFYVTANDPQLLRPAFIDKLRKHIKVNPWEVFKTFQYVLFKRPELIQENVVKSVVKNIHPGTNQAFYFLREVVQKRPEYMPISTLAFFECVLREPHFYIKREMLQDIMSIAQMSHVKTNLEATLRETVDGGTRLARTLMAIMFRQRLRVRQRVLMDSLDNALMWQPVWQFLLFLLEATDAKTISSAAAEEFLEDSYHLHMLVTPHDYRNILVDRIDLTTVPEVQFPEDMPFLNEEEDLVKLYRNATHLAEQLSVGLRMRAIVTFRERIPRTEEERRALTKLRKEATTRRRQRMTAREKSLDQRLERWREGKISTREQRELAKKVRDGLHHEIVEMTLKTIRNATMDAYRAAVKTLLGKEYDLSRVDSGVLPSFMYLQKMKKGNTRKYLARIIEDRLEGREHDWLWTEAPVEAWKTKVREQNPDIRFDRWRAEYKQDFSYAPKDAARERQRRINEDLKQTRNLFGNLDLKKLELDVDLENAGYKALREAYLKVRSKTAEEVDSQVVEEIGVNLERIRITEQTPDSDFEGQITLEVETDPLQVLFMGEYGFASCLSIRGSNVWSAVSNAIDIDKVIIWAKEPNGNIVGRRLIALMPNGVISYRTYTNRHGLSLDGFFSDFVEAYAAHCGTAVTHEGSPGALLRDQWYDDGSV